MCTIRKLSQYRQRDFEGHGISCAFACWFRIVHRPRIPMVLLDASGVLLRRARHVLPPNCFFGFHDGQEQAANAGAQQWDYCVPKPNYAEVRARVGSAFAEKAHELADAVAVVQGLSKEATRLPGIVVVHFLALFRFVDCIRCLHGSHGNPFNLLGVAITFHDLLGAWSCPVQVIGRD